MSRVALIVFIKNFQRGKVKTRLGRSLGDEAALDIYRQLCTFTTEEVKKTGLPAWFYFSDDTDETFLAERSLGADQDLYEVRVQSGPDLGSRMNRAFEEVAEKHESAFILGTDCPYLDARKIMKAADLLVAGDVDIVVGPAEDGGYYGLGMKGPHNVFSDVDWSTDQVLDQTIARIEDMDLTYILLEKLSDIDNESDWLEFQKSSSEPYFREIVRSSSLASDTDFE